MAFFRLFGDPSRSSDGGHQTQRLEPRRPAADAKAAAEAKVIADPKAAAESADSFLRLLAPEAKLAAEKRLAWSGPAMRRAGFKEEQISRTLIQGGSVVARGINDKSEFDKGQTTVPAGLSGVLSE